MENSLNQIEQKLETMEKNFEKPLSQVFTFIKNHKRVLVVIGIVYFVYNYLFKE